MNAGTTNTPSSVVDDILEVVSDIDGNVQSYTDSIGTLLAVAADLIEQDPMMSAQRVRSLIGIARTLATDLRNEVNVDAERLGANYVDKAERDFTLLWFKQIDAMRRGAAKTEGSK